MGVKETPISDTADTADEDEGKENGDGEEQMSEETPPEEDSKQEEAPEDKPKRAKAKPEAKKKAEAKPEAKAETSKKAEAKPKKKAEAKPEKKAEAKPKKEEKPEESEETPKPAKQKAKKETVDMKQKTMCSICKSEPISTDALLYTHSCKKEALAKRKTAPLYDEEPNAHCHGNATGESVSRGNPVAAPVGSLSQAAPSYREILAKQQQEMRRQKAARIVNPIRAHFFGYAL